MEHLSTAHVGAGKARYTCEWDGCERSTCLAAFEEGEDPEVLGDGEWERRREEREDKGVFRQRQKVMRHLQMHTGELRVGFRSSGPVRGGARTSCSPGPWNERS